LGLEQIGGQAILTCCQFGLKLRHEHLTTGMPPFAQLAICR